MWAMGVIIYFMLNGDYPFSKYFAYIDPTRDK
jgi:hypothetical protein